jgi:hypothetical protein
VLLEGFGWNKTLADTANDEVTVPEQSKETEYCQEALDAIEFGWIWDEIRLRTHVLKWSRQRKGSN